MSFIPQYEPLIEPAYADAVSKQILSGWVGPAETTIEFEEKICEITGAKYCVSTTSGTVALMMAWKASGIVCEPKVFFPAYTFLAGANAMRFFNGRISFVDIKQDTLSMDPDQLKQVYDKVAIQGNIHWNACIFVNHNAYVGPDVQEIKDFCEAHGMIMIEDSAQALGMPNAGRTGDMGIFSFSVPKIVTTGQGGAVITDRDDLYENLIKVRDHGGDWRKTRTHNALGVNFKFNDILTSFGLEQLKILDDLLLQRNMVFDRYRKHIKLVDFGYKSTWMVIHESKNPDRVIEALKEKEIQAVKYYRAINQNPIYENNKRYPNAEHVAESHIYLPSSLCLKETQIDRICEIINENN